MAFEIRLGILARYIPEEGETIVTIPDGVSTIGCSAFSDCEALTQVILPDGVREIQYSAFSDCSNITKIRIPDTVNKIEDYAFENCKKLKEIDFPDNEIDIDGNPFRNCKGLSNQEGFVILKNRLYGYYSKNSHVVIPQGVTEIVEWAFDRCKTLQKVVIPSTVTKIGTGAFACCEKLKEIDFPDNEIDIDGNPFGDCKGLSNQEGLVILKNRLYGYYSKNSHVVIPQGVTEIALGAFYGRDTLQEVVIPNTVTKIGESAFYNCYNLTEITIPGTVSEIKRYTFGGCTGLTKINISEGVTKISMFAFNGCSSLTDVHIPESVTQIEGDAFQGCTKLKTVYFGSYCPQIDSNVFPDHIEFRFPDHVLQHSKVNAFVLSHMNTDNVTSDDFAYILANMSTKSYLKFINAANTNASEVLKKTFKLLESQKVNQSRADFIFEYIAKNLPKLSAEDIAAAIDFFEENYPETAERLKTAKQGGTKQSKRKTSAVQKEIPQTMDKIKEFVLPESTEDRIKIGIELVKQAYRMISSADARGEYSAFIVSNCLLSYTDNSYNSSKIETFVEAIEKSLPGMKPFLRTNLEEILQKRAGYCLDGCVDPKIAIAIAAAIILFIDINAKIAFIMKRDKYNYENDYFERYDMGYMLDSSNFSENGMIFWIDHKTAGGSMVDGDEIMRMYRRRKPKGIIVEDYSDLYK